MAGLLAVAAVPAVAAPVASAAAPDTSITSGPPDRK
jgi:hypothetical protein